MSFDIQRIGAADTQLLAALSTCFGVVFSDETAYTAKRPSQAYLESLLAKDTFIALVAIQDEQIVGGIAAYELQKFEQERSEIYIYDLAVVMQARRQGIATALLAEVVSIGKQKGAHAVFVQADTNEEDQPALALYTKLGIAEQVIHFDLDMDMDKGVET